MTETGKSKRGFIRRARLIRPVRLVAVFAVSLCLTSPQAFAQYNGMSMRTGPSMNVGPRININPTIRYSPNLRYDGYDDPGPRPRIMRNLDQGAPDDISPRKRPGKAKSTPATTENTYVAKEVLIEIAGNPTDAQGRRHRAGAIA